MLRAFMRYVADLHLHSKYSRAVSKSMTLPVMAEYARIKGLDILTAFDWTHTLWFKEIREQLEEEYEGVYKLKNQNLKVKITSQNSKDDNDVLSYYLLRYQAYINRGRNCAEFIISFLRRVLKLRKRSIKSS